MILLNYGNLTIEGESIGGLATYLRIKELDLIFDLGRCPISFIGTNHVFITHFHLDHYFGLPIYVSQRWLSNMPPGKIFVPEEGMEQLQNILDSIAKLDSQQTWNPHLISVKIGDRIPFRRNLVTYAIAVNHTIPAIGYLVCEIRNKLKPEYLGRPGSEIAELRRTGVPITNQLELPLIAYLGDTQSVSMDSHPLLNRCQILICECTFLLPGDRQRAEKTKHFHLDSLISLVKNFNGDKIILTHFSQRYSTHLIQQQIEQAIPDPTQRAKIGLFI